MSAKPLSVKSARLDKLLANLGYGSRREIQALARMGEIRLDGDDLTDAGARIALDPDLPSRLTVADEPLDPLPGLCLMLHKPLGVTCSHKEAGPLVYGLLPERWRRREPPLSTVGRLDKDTSGLLLLTDDGAVIDDCAGMDDGGHRRIACTAGCRSPLVNDGVSVRIAATASIADRLSSRPKPRPARISS